MFGIPVSMSAAISGYRLTVERITRYLSPSLEHFLRLLVKCSYFLCLFNELSFLLEGSQTTLKPSAPSQNSTKTACSRYCVYISQRRSQANISLVSGECWFAGLDAWSHILWLAEEGGEPSADLHGHRWALIAMALSHKFWSQSDPSDDLSVLQWQRFPSILFSKSNLLRS